MRLSNKWTVADALRKILEADAKRYHHSHNLNNLEFRVLQLRGKYLLPYRTLAEEGVTTGDTIKYVNRYW